MPWKKKSDTKVSKSEKEEIDMEELKRKVREDMEKEKKGDKPNDENVRVMVVKELPVQQVREGRDEKGNIINFITVEEALTEILNS